MSYAYSQQLQALLTPSLGSPLSKGIATEKGDLKIEKLEAEYQRSSKADRLNSVCDCLSSRYFFLSQVVWDWLAWKEVSVDRILKEMFKSGSGWVRQECQDCHPV